MMLLEDAEWSQWTDGAIGRKAGVGPKTVAAIRRSLGNFQSEKTTTRIRTDKHGNVSEMNVARIGRRPSAEPRPPQLASNVIQADRAGHHLLRQLWAEAQNHASLCKPGRRKRFSF